MVIYPTADEIVEINLLALTVVEVKKADAQKTLSRPKLNETIEKCKEKKGDIFDKAVVLL